MCAGEGEAGTGEESFGELVKLTDERRLRRVGEESFGDGAAVSSTPLTGHSLGIAAVAPTKADANARTIP